MKRPVVIVFFLIAVLVLAGGSASLYSQGNKGKAQDPVCLLWVDKDPKLSATYKGETYYFCLTRDLQAFKENPSKWVGKK